MAVCGMRVWMSSRQRSISAAEGCSWLDVYRVDLWVATAQVAALVDALCKKVFAFMVCLGDGSV
ncbi:MAG: hypothetical protein A2Z55_00665 [Burkholderiales bacterium RIFCSPHIGHO2_12_63_9]|nr:MAG: hypothetical protein A2Z55_00665 [Burkholderiales bacterium RIFCSPHIGHO2_12_63_9]